VCCIGGAIGGGNMFQANQTFQMYLRVAGEASFFADKGWLFGIGLAVLTGLAIIGGIKSIAAVSEKIFPLMAVLYIAIGLYIVGVNIEHLPKALSSIFGGLFTAEAATGGVLGALIMGVKRAVFSNEAGCGSAPITYGAVKSDSHIAQGIIVMLNPFIDTVVICTITALVIAVTGVYTGGQGMEGIALTARAFATAGEWTIYWLGATVFLFAYSTLISWYYLGEKAFTYLAGRKKATVAGFKIFYCLCVVVGSAAKLGNVIDFTDALFFAMAIPNVIVLYMMAPEIKRDLKAYLEDLKAKKAAG
jgi:AGCS family alanine or glycine:cation symporter